MAGGVQSIIASFFTGAIFAAAWIILIDGIVSANKTPLTPPFYWYYSIPAILCSITNILMNLVTAAQLSSRGGVFDDGSSATKVRVWFFATVAATFCCIGGAMWIIIQNYGVGSQNPWPGIALMLQTILVTIAGFLFFFARGKRSSYGEL